jgi:maleate isomerase
MTQLADYGSQGLIGVLTPQANTTVEPECWTLLPPGYSMLNARLTSECCTIEQRLLDYTTKFEATAEQFANAPIEAIVIACTGASYLIGEDKETAIIERIKARYVCP